MSQCLTRLMFVVWLALVGVGAGSAAAMDFNRDYALVDLVASLAPDAEIDWNREDSAGFELQNDFVVLMFSSGARDGVSGELLGSKPAVLSVEVVKFDILSDFEQLFCCAMNEVSAYLELRDQTTNQILIPRELVDFDHVGRGGFLGLLAAAEGQGQLDRLHEVIRINTSDWIRRSIATDGSS